MIEQIKEKFDDIAIKYDKQRKFLIPCFNDFYNIIVDLIESKINQLKILDIGAGTGLLTSFIYDKYKNARYTLIDLSNEMLNIARKRFTNMENFKFINDDYIKYNFKEKFDIIVSSLSIHHLDDNAKKIIYKKVFDSLNNKGIFINGDQVSGSTKSIEKQYRKHWIKMIENSPLKKEEKESAYDRMKLDKMTTLENNIKSLKKSGFKEIDLFYKYYNFCVLYCKKV